LSKATERQPYELLRFNENWQSFDSTSETEQAPFDSIKYIPLNNSGDVWLSMGGQVRYRGENWKNFNFNNPADSVHDDSFSLFRGFIHTDFHFGEHLRLFIMAKSALSEGRELSGERRSVDVDTIALQNAFVDFTHPISAESDLTLRAGRQQLLFGSRRLLDPPFWANVKRPLDGFSAILTTTNWTFTPFSVRPVVIHKYDRNRTDDNVHFSGLSVEGQFNSSLSDLDMYLYRFSNKNVTINGTSGDEKRYTVGAHIKGSFPRSSLDYDIEAAYQFGGVNEHDIHAYMLATELGYSFKQWRTAPRIFLGLEFATGDNASGGDVETFNQLFPLGHASFGYVDMVGRQNIIDLRQGISFLPNPKLTIKIEGHYFWRESIHDALYNPGGKVVRNGELSPDRDIGQEIDISAKYRYDRHIGMLMGYSKFFAGDFIKQSGSASSINFAYLMLEYTF